MTMREREVKDAHEISEKNPHLLLLEFHKDTFVVHMDSTNHTFPYLKRRIPEHANFVATTQSLKVHLARDS